jgi:hypothetical protein
MRLKWLTLFVVAMNVYCQNNTSSQAVDNAVERFEGSNFSAHNHAGG